MVTNHPPDKLRLTNPTGIPRDLHLCTPAARSLFSPTRKSAASWDGVRIGHLWVMIEARVKNAEARVNDGLT